jgi:hypothetical protein
MFDCRMIARREITNGRADRHARMHRAQLAHDRFDARRGQRAERTRARLFQIDERCASGGGLACLVEVTHTDEQADHEASCAHARS